MKKAPINNSQSCENCGSFDNEQPFKACSRCRLVYYCSKDCQITHWKSGHKKTCIPINDRRVINHHQQQQQQEELIIDSKNVNNSEQNKLDPVCAICLGSLSNASLMLPCEHTFHPSCIKNLRAQAELSKVCPLCRTDLPPGPEEAHSRALSLYNKLDGNFDCKSQVDEMMMLFTCSAEEGYAVAQFNLGVIYTDGLVGVKQDYFKAFEWYLKGASQGNLASQNNLGTMYCNGQGVKQDYVEAREWWLQAASQGHPASHNNLARMYKFGLGVKEDPVKAQEWRQSYFQELQRLENQQAECAFIQSSSNLTGSLRSLSASVNDPSLSQGLEEALTVLTELTELSTPSDFRSRWPVALKELTRLKKTIHIHGRKK